MSDLIREPSSRKAIVSRWGVERRPGATLNADVGVTRLSGAMLSHWGEPGQGPFLACFLFFLVTILLLVRSDLLNCRKAQAPQAAMKWPARRPTRTSGVLHESEHVMVVTHFACKFEHRHALLEVFVQVGLIGVTTMPHSGALAPRRSGLSPSFGALVSDFLCPACALQRLQNNFWRASIRVLGGHHPFLHGQLPP